MSSGWYDSTSLYRNSLYKDQGSGDVGDKICYGYFKDIQKPELTAAVEEVMSSPKIQRAGIVLDQDPHCSYHIPIM